LKIGVSLQPQHVEYEELRDGWRAAEDAGADAVFVWDHFFPLHGDENGKHLECLMLLAAMAAATERVEIGSLVCSVHYRNVNLLVDMFRTIDRCSGGRTILGIGSGWFEREYLDYGYDFGTTRSRLDDLEAALPVIRERLRQLHPPPVRDPMPIMIGGSGEKVTLRIVAEHADIWNAFGEAEVAARGISVLDEWCAKVGRDPAEIERSVLFYAKDLKDPEDYAAAGFTHLIYGSPGHRPDFGPLRDLIAWRDSRR
jgi:probable F420-dependent oxidoreductase